MAALIEAAAAECAKAQRLRVEAQGLRFVARRTTVRSRQQAARLGGTYTAACRGPLVFPSPWSALLWQRPGRELDNILEAL